MGLRFRVCNRVSCQTHVSHLLPVSTPCLSDKVCLRLLSSRMSCQASCLGWSLLSHNFRHLAWVGQRFLTTSGILLGLVSTFSQLQSSCHVGQCFLMTSGIFDGNEAANGSSRLYFIMLCLVMADYLSKFAERLVYQTTSLNPLVK